MPHLLEKNKNEGIFGYLSQNRSKKLTVNCIVNSAWILFLVQNLNNDEDSFQWLM